MLRQITCRCFILTLILMMLAPVAAAFDISADVEKILREIRQDQPVPALSYLQKEK